MDYEVAIPSYRRAHVLAAKTLPMLRRLGVPLDRQTIYVANETEAAEYRALIPDVKIVVGVLGLLKQRRFYHSQYPEGTRLIGIDDDVEDLFELDGKKVKPYEGSMEDLVKIGYGLCDQVGARLWGLNYAFGSVFMADAGSVGLSLVCGVFQGTYAGDPAVVGDDRGYLESSEEDGETTLRSYLAYGAVVNLRWISPKTVYMADGGIVAELAEQGIERKTHTSLATEEIARRYPGLTRIVEIDGVKQIRYQTKNNVRIPRSLLEEAYLP